MADRGLRELGAYAAVRGLLRVLSPLPWRSRLRAAALVGRGAVASVPNLRARIYANLAHVMPETSAQERRRIADGVGACFGRTALELFCSRDFVTARLWGEPTGPGLAAVEAALAERRGAVIVSGHYGGWEAIRAWLKERRAPCISVYRPMSNPRLDGLYHASILQTGGGPVYPKTRHSVRALVRHLAQGGFVTLLVDQYERRAPMLDFLGQPAPTTLVPAELALKFRVPLIPAFATRATRDERIDIVFDAPIAPTTSLRMMQDFNDRLAGRVRACPDQYYWLHRRWSKTLGGG